MMAYQVQYILHCNLSLKEENYTFRMKTRQKDAIIMEAPGHRYSNDRIKIEIRNSRLFITYNTGGELVMLCNSLINVHYYMACATSSEKLGSDWLRRSDWQSLPQTYTKHLDCGFSKSITDGRHH